MNHPHLRQMLQAAGLLAAFTCAGLLLVVVTYYATRDTVAENARQGLLSELSQLVPPQRYDNDLLKDSLQRQDQKAFGNNEPTTLYRAYQNNQPVAILATIYAPDGYAGPIKLLVAVNADGQLAGVRTLAHKETPGLGDKIDIQRNPWIDSFTGKSLTNPTPEHWKVKKDGGDFDQFTGATITPRAVVGAVQRFLHYYQQHKDELFAAPRGEGTS